MNDTTLTMVGNLTHEPAFRMTPNGVAVASLRVASTARVYDRTLGQWRDGDTLYLSLTCWRQLAEHAAETLRKGDRVIFTGRLRMRTYEAADATRRTIYEVDADALGPELLRCAATLNRTQRSGHGEAATATDGSPSQTWQESATDPFAEPAAASASVTVAA